MSKTSPTRRILSDLNVNSFGTPTTMRLTGKVTSSLKRGFHDVAELEPSPAASRVCSELSPSSKRPERWESQGLKAQEDPSRIPETNILADAVSRDRSDTMGNSDSPQSDNDSMTLSIDSQAEGDTINSQQTAATEVTLHTQSVAALHAENLRLRLRVALFKVQTNQTSIPMSQLQLKSERNRVQTSWPRESSQSVRSVSPQNQHQASHPKLLPAPILRPTIYSARTIVQPHDPPSHPHPTNSSPESIVRDEGFRTPALPRTTPDDLTRLRSPSGSPSGREERDVVREPAKDENLTSSAVRGKAAFSLLGLRGVGP